MEYIPGTSPNSGRNKHKVLLMKSEMPSKILSHETLGTSIEHNHSINLPLAGTTASILALKRFHSGQRILPQ